MLKNLYVFIAFFILTISCKQNEIVPKYSKFKTEDSQLNYRILYPKDFDQKKSYPLTLFLHGIGERGDDNELQLTYVDKVFLNQKNYENYPAFIVFPQSPLNDSWSSRNLSDNKMKKYKYQYFCDTCNKTFASKAHILTHTKEKTHQCIICEQQFSSITYMKRHMKIHKEHFRNAGSRKIVDME